MRNTYAAAFALVAAFSAAPAPAAPPPAVVSTPPIRAGALTAYKYGSGAKTLILLPGLTSGAFVWDSTVAALAPKYTMYAVTFDGFDGMPPAKPPYTQTFAKSVEQLIRDQHLSKPVLVGHSLGGDIALMVGIDEPSALSGIVAVDSLPMYPPLQPGETLASRQASAPKYGAAMMAQSESEFDASTKGALAAMVTDPSQAATLYARAIKSDRATVAGSAVELASNDLAPQLPKITVPVLVLPSTALFGADPSKSFFEAAYKGTPVLTVVAIPNSRHFIMYDQPQAFQAALSGFVDGLK